MAEPYVYESDLTEAEKAKVRSYISLYASEMLTNANLDFAIDDGALSLSRKFFGDKYCKAVAFQTMHTLSMSTQTVNGGGVNGFLSEKSIGPVKVKYAEFNFKGRNSALQTTKFGVMLDDLIKTCGCGISVNHAWRLF